MPAKRTTTTKTTSRQRRLAQAEEAVRQRLGLDTLETRNSDRLDFHDLSVASIREAIRIAFNEGYAAAGGAADAIPAHPRPAR